MYVKRGLVRDTTVAMLYALRVCGMAPVSIVRKNNGYQFRVLRSYALYGYILITFINFGIRDFISVCYMVFLVTTHVISYICNILAMTSINKYAMMNAIMILWVTEMLSSIIITLAASLNSYRRIGEFIENMRSFDKTSAKIKIPRDNGRTYKIIIIFVILTRLLLDASYVFKLADEFGILKFISCMYMTATITNLFICVLLMHIYISYTEVSLRIEYIKDELQDLVDNRLVCDDSTYSFYTHSVDEKVKNLHDVLYNIKTIYLKLNKHFENLFVFILLNISIRTILYFYGIASVVQKGFEHIHHGDGVIQWYSELYGIHNFITMFVLVQPFRDITCKLGYIKLLMGRIMTMNNYVFRVFLNVDTFYEELLSYNFSYTPLGIMTIERSIIIKILAIGITCTAAILPF